MIKPLVSVIVPCFNYGHFLELTLQSVYNQTFQNWECWIIDDGSTDSTSEVALKFENSDSRFKYFYQKNGGLSAARNQGIKLAKGNYLQFLDADDLIESNKLSNQINFLMKNPDVDIVISEYKYFFSKFKDVDDCLKLNEEVKIKLRMGFDHINLIEAFLNSNLIAVNAPLLNSKVVSLIGGFNENLKSLEDWEFWLRALIKGCKMKFINFTNSAALIRLHGNSMSTNSDVMLQMNIAMRTKIQPLLEINSELFKQNLKLIKQLESHTAFNQIYSGNLYKGLINVVNLSLKNENYIYNLLGAMYWLKARVLSKNN